MTLILIRLILVMGTIQAVTVGVTATQPLPVIRIDAALSSVKKEVELFLSGDTMYSAAAYNPRGSGPIAEYISPNISQTIQAIVAPDDTYFPFWVYFKDNGMFVKKINQVKRFKYGPIRKFLRNGGPDAAGRRADGAVNVFKGCDVVVRRDWNDWGDTTDVRTLGLPCNVDAAWLGFEDSETKILKYDQIWSWNMNGTVTGPMDANSIYAALPWRFASESNK